ncbi:helix-turn-helix domain-containing protein, partial [Limosilactobacillus fermentum]
MSRNSKFSAEDKLRIINEMKNIDVDMVAKKYEISRFALHTWQLKYKYQGIEGLRSAHQNQHYSKKFKANLVQQYQASNHSLEEFAIKNGLKSKQQLLNWIHQYNGSNLRAYTPRKRDSKMT